MNSQLIEGSGRNSISNVIQAALLASAALFNFGVQQGEHARLKPEYAQFMTTLTEHSTSTSNTYACLIFGYAYLGGWAGLQSGSLFVHSSPGPVQQCNLSVADTQTDKEPAPSSSRRDTHAQAEHVQRADGSAQTEGTQPDAAHPLAEMKDKCITDSEIQAIMQAVLASDRTLDYDSN